MLSYTFLGSGLRKKNVLHLNDKSLKVRINSDIHAVNQPYSLEIMPPFVPGIEGKHSVFFNVITP